MIRSLVPVAALALVAADPAGAQIAEPNRRPLPDWTLRSGGEVSPDGPAGPAFGSDPGRVEAQPAIRADFGAALVESRRRAASGNGVDWLGPSLEVPDSVPAVAPPPPPPIAGIRPGPERPAARTTPPGARDPLDDPSGAPVAGGDGRPPLPVGSTALPAGARPAGTRRDPRTGRIIEPERGPVKPAEPAGPVPPGLRGLPEDPLAEAEDPYAPIGLRAGGFLLFPSLEAGVGRTSNVEGQAGGKAGVVTTLTPELKLRSDWSRHSLEMDLRGTYTAYPKQSSYDTRTVTANLKGRIDLDEGTRIDLSAGYTAGQEKAGSAEARNGQGGNGQGGNGQGGKGQSGAKGRTGDVETATASAGVTRDLGMVFATLRGDVEQNRYTAASGAGAAAARADAGRDNTRVTGAVRVGLNLSPAVKPYVEAQATRRTYATVTAGTRPDADGHGLRGGVQMDFGPILKGDLSAGWSTEEARRPGEEDLAGLTVDGSVTWAPTRLTKVTASAKTAFEPTTLAGSSGSVARTASLALTQSVTRAVDLEAGAAATDRRYVGIDTRETSRSANAGLVWKFNPWSQAFLRGQYETFRPSGKDPDYSVATVTVGVKVQR